MNNALDDIKKDLDEAANRCLALIIPGWLDYLQVKWLSQWLYGYRAERAKLRQRVNKQEAKGLTPLLAFISQSYDAVSRMQTCDPPGRPHYTLSRKDFGAAIREVRQARGLSLRQVEVAIGKVSTKNWLEPVEAGQKAATHSEAQLIAKALSIPLGCLAILKARSVGDSNEATEFLLSLQRLIARVIEVQASYGKMLPEKERQHRRKLRKDRLKPIGLVQSALRMPGKRKSSASPWERLLA